MNNYFRCHSTIAEFSALEIIKTFELSLWKQAILYKCDENKEN